MKNKLYLSISFYALSMLSYSTVYSMENQEQLDSDEKLIEFKGEKYYLCGWILASQLDPKHPFSTTSVIRAESNTFIDKGDILDLDGKDFEDIAQGNCVHCKFYALKKTRLSHGRYDETGAIILGTKDKEACDKLHFAHMHSIMDQYKKDKETLDTTSK